LVTRGKKWYIVIFQRTKKCFEIGRQILEQNKFAIDIEKNPENQDELLLSGTDAIAIGAIAGGCTFISSYPMSPSTGVLTFLSQHALDFGIIVDQAEDEIAAMNKGLGAWYAGGRAMITTSGGGFTLMTEGLSLAGMIESPMVVHLAQRPAPATGLPTRTEQGDLRHILNASHGDFPRVIFAPGTLEEAFHLTQKSFNLADKFQVPVFVLTDQFFVDSFSNTPVFDLSGIEVKQNIVETESTYKRYQLTENSVSPRGIPSFGEGLVVVDSDEHDEQGHITEDLEFRPRMVEKRYHNKLHLLRKEALPPKLIGKSKDSLLAVGWGSNFYVLQEAVEGLENDDVFIAYFSQVYPLHSKTRDLLDDAKKVVVVENNATGQFADLLFFETGYNVKVENRLLKYDGLPFPVEDVVQFLTEKLERM
jgi:2-oxoglutarate ferredoxin oxidoreductase subunit alpha